MVLIVEVVSLVVLSSNKFVRMTAIQQSMTSELKERNKQIYVRWKTNLGKSEIYMKD